MPFTALAIGAGAGLLKSELDKPKERQQAAMRAMELRASPWTHLAPTTQVHQNDPLGDALSYGTAGAQLGQNIQNAQTNQDLAQANIGWLNRGGNPQMSGPLMQGQYGPMASPWANVNSSVPTAPTYDENFKLSRF